MGDWLSRPTTITLDDFQLPPGRPARVDRASISAVWAKTFPQVELLEKDLDALVPSAAITEENNETFDDFKEKFLRLGNQKIVMQLWLEEDKTKGPWNSEEWYTSAGESLVKTVFSHYDVNGDGVLDKEESAIFYSHFTVEFNKLVPESVPETSNPVMEACMKSQLQMKIAANIHRKEGMQAYQANKEKKDKAAFAIMDGDGDGKLQLQEVLDSFRPCTDLRQEVLKTLGMHDKGAK